MPIMRGARQIRLCGIRVWFLPACVLLLTPGCFASTRMTSVTNPEWAPEAPIGSMLVWVVSEDLSLRREMEAEFEARASEYDVEIVPAFNVFFPGDSYSEDDVLETLRRREITAILYLVPGASGARVVQRPTTTTTGCSIWTSSQGCVQTRSTTSEGSASRLLAEYSLSLVGAIDQRTIWTASATSSGNDFARQGNLRKSHVGKTLNHLREDGILIKRP